MTAMATISMGVIKKNDRVAGYTFTGDETECRRQLDLLTAALHALMPGSRFSTSTMVDRQAMAAVSLQMVALLERCTVPEETNYAVRSTLNAVHRHMVELRKDRMRNRDLSSEQAGLMIIDGYDYFGHDWGMLLLGAGVMQK